MAAVGPQIPDHNEFVMHFNQMNPLEQLIRSGNQLEAVHTDLRVHDRVEVYERAMHYPDGPDPVLGDFGLDQDGLINPENSSGKNLCSL